MINRKVNIFSCLVLLASCFSSPAICQTTETTTGGAKKYDEIIDLNSLESIRVKRLPESTQEKAQEKIQKDELALLLPNLDSPLYKNWTLAGEPKIYKDEELANYTAVPPDLLNELQIEKILKQTYQNENRLVSAIIYKFKNFAGAYSAYTVLHTGTTTKLKVGKNASESEKSVNFWKGNYFIDIHTEADNDNIGKEFTVLASQEISSNIKIEQLPPVVAIQMPSLFRLQDSEKYCLGNICTKMFFLASVPDFPVNLFDLQNAGGIIKAEYKLQENSKDGEKIILILSRYLDKEVAHNVFNLLRESFEKKKSENKDIEVDVDLDDSLVQIKNQKDNYIMVKQKGNLLTIAYGVTDKKSGKKVLDLVPWPIEINRN